MLISGTRRAATRAAIAALPTSSVQVLASQRRHLSEPTFGRPHLCAPVCPPCSCVPSARRRWSVHWSYRACVGTPHSDVQAKLELLKQSATDASATHLGYPYNLNVAYGDLAPFLSFFLNNLGDAYAGSNYGVNTQVQQPP
jgi:hypothetical protein